jgi:hypothetical protein
MSFSRITAAVSLAALCASGCGGPSTGPTTPQTISQTNAAAGGSEASSADRSQGVDAVLHRQLFWRPNPLKLQKGTKATAKLFYRGPGSLQVADDCTGRVAFDQIGVARIKKIRINVYEALALRAGPFHCGVIAKTAGQPARHAILHVFVAP